MPAFMVGSVPEMVTNRYWNTKGKFTFNTAHKLFPYYFNYCIKQATSIHVSVALEQSWLYNRSKLAPIQFLVIKLFYFPCLV